MDFTAHQHELRSWARWSWAQYSPYIPVAKYAILGKSNVGMAKEMAKEVASETLDFPSTGQRERRSLTFWRITAAVLTFSFFLLWTWPWISPRISTSFVAGPDSDVPDIGYPESFLRSWAQYSPYIPVAKYAPPPPGCVVSQVNLLQRHGARWPTSGSGKEMKKAVGKLQHAKHFKEHYLDFLKDFKWDLGTNDLLPLGAKQSFEAGGVAFDRYAHILRKENPPFVRAAGLPRVVASAHNWTAGFRKANHNTIKAKLDLVIPEASNLTLDDGMCPNAKGGKESKTWLKIFAGSIEKRLNAAAPGAHLKKKDTHSLMSLCAFHSQFLMAPSPFCGLFSAEEFTEYSYHSDLAKFYTNGYGANLGRVQGVGYVNELLARLTGLPVQDHTQTNRTLDGSPKTFPLDRTFYADFSHDNEMVSIYSALGLFRQYLLPEQKLDPANPSPLRTWVTSNLVPFSARMVVEKLQCGDERLPVPKGVFVRILVNDAVQPLEFCGGVAGLCELHAFVASQGYARQDGEGDFEKCLN
jgi:hypothetical protein